MKPIDQTIFGERTGNCLAACIASIFECSIDEVGPFSPDGWHDDLARWLAPRGFFPICLSLAAETWRPQGLYVLAGRSPRGDFLHAVVARGREIVHDPHPDRTGVLSHVDVTFFAVLDPAAR